MSDKSAIEWTDATWNPVTGCTKVSAGCDHCYAETFAERWRGVPGHHFEQGFDVTLRPERLHQPLEWKKPRRVFVNSMSDLFHDDIPDAFIARVFAVMARAERHTFQILTKRHGRMRSLLSASWFPELVTTWAWREGVRPDGPIVEFPLPNVWLGVSVEDQKRADLRIPALLATPAAVRFISAEPLLGPVRLADGLYDYDAFGRAYVCREHGTPNCEQSPKCNRLGWVIVGGESGHGARPMHPAWARSLRDQCEAAAIPFFLKQLGEYSPYLPMIPDVSRPDGRAPDWDRPAIWLEETTGRTVTDEPTTGSWQAVYRVGKKTAGRTLDGQTWDQYPAVSS